MTDASRAALEGLRDPSTIQWYVIPLLAIVFYVYTSEIKKARESGNWDAVVAGTALFGTDFLFETINGWVFHLTGWAALWSTPGETALRTTVGWNIEIMFMFSLAGIICYNTLPERQGTRRPRLADRLFWAAAYAAFCVAVECFLNSGGHLVWEYPFWQRTPMGVLPIYFAGYLPLFTIPMLIIGAKTDRGKAAAVAAIYTAAIVMNIAAFGFLGFHY